MQTDNPQLLIVTAKARADKAINELKGILEGILLDKIVNLSEAEELLNWCHKHNGLVRRNPFNELMYVIKESVSENIPSTEAIEDMFYLCQKYEGDNYYYNAVTTDIQTLHGICHGILADGEITDEEVFNLHTWLNRNTHLNTFYPYDEIRSMVLSIVRDKKVDEDEKLVLKAYFKQFANIINPDIKQKIDEDTKDISIAEYCTSEPEVIFEGKTFCITGALKRGKREELQNDISKLGGIPVNNISKKTDYLIVADHGNPAWAFSCYGRKIEQAIGLRKAGHSIMLIHEFDFCDIIDDLL